MNGIPQAHSISALIDNKLQTTNLALQFPSDRPKYYTQIQIRDVQGATAGGTVGGQASYKDVATIILPLPVNLVETHQVKYDEKAILPWVSGSAQLANAFDPSGTAGAALDLAVHVGGALIGLAPNEYQTIIFDRPMFRRHELSFKLSPKNFDESTKIKAIIKELHRAMSPAQGASFLWEFPDFLMIKYMPNEEWLYKFKPAVIENMGINYAGGANKKAFYRDESGPGSNPPESVEITLHLLETEFWIEQDYGGAATSPFTITSAKDAAAAFITQFAEWQMGRGGMPDIESLKGGK